MSTVSVSFHHGLGDCANFARIIPLYTNRGYKVAVECEADKAVLFRAAGADVVTKAHTVHSWYHAPHEVHSGHGRDWQGNKPGWNISEPPLPNIGDKAQLWVECCENQVRVLPHVSDKDMQIVEEWLSDLPRPVVLLHTKGHAGQETKSLSDAIAVSFYMELLARFSGTIVLLDWDNRVPRLASWRVRHLDDFKCRCTTERLFALIEQSDLLIGVDSGPLHACGLTDTPAVGIWMPGHYPSQYAFPRRQQLNIVLADHTRQWNRYRRIPWNIVEHPGTVYDPQQLAEFCSAMLRRPRYLPDDRLPADVQMQQFVLVWCRNRSGNERSLCADREHSFDVLFRETTKRFEKPTIVETGTIRAEEDWEGSGFFTYLAGAYVSYRGGELHSVDVYEDRCRFAELWCRPFGDCVRIHHNDSVAFLHDFGDAIDVLYLDSLDVSEPGHAEHALREVQQALPRMHEQSIVAFDDTPWNSGAFTAGLFTSTYSRMVRGVVPGCGR